ncbi:FCD domain-containing protein [Roseibium sp. SCP14]|uniref:FCD domain-containing protein n=1 Tax=Roseibium sp. SCP14 TaxID=3141375 RepID=UPI003335C7A5
MSSPRLVEEDDGYGFYKLDEEMHRLILSFTGYRRITGITQTAWMQVNRARYSILPMESRMDNTLKEHSAIVEAIANKDPEAAREATKFHLQ